MVTVSNLGENVKVYYNKRKVTKKNGVVISKEDYYVRVDMFLGVFQRSEVIGESPMVGGHSGGQISYPVAIIVLDGEVKEVAPETLRFEGL